MAKTVKESFRIFSSNLNITDKQTSVVSTCRENVVKEIGTKLTLHPNYPSKLIGSYDRDTQIRYLSEGDVDVMVVLNHGVHKDWDNEDGVSKALSRFKSILDSAYPNTPCSVDRNCVTMKLSQFQLDVIPAFRYQEGYYTIPDTYRKKWLQTNPVSFSSEVTRINKNMNGAFIPLIKMVKAWNREYKTVNLRGFHIECMMINHFQNYNTNYTYDSMLNVFFSKLAGYVKNVSYDPIMFDRVDLYLDNNSLGYNRDLMVKRCERVANQLNEAYSTSEDYPATAIGKWKAIMGEFFPTYG